MAAGGAQRKQTTGDVGDAQRAMLFQSALQQSSRGANDNAGGLGQTGLGGAEPANDNRSPLDLPQQSYALPQEEEVEGVASTIAEMQTQRAREAKMKETAEQLVGGPVVGGGAAPSAEIPQAQKQSAQRAASEAEAGGEAAQAQTLVALQAQAIQQQSKQTEAQQGAAAQAQAQTIKQKRDLLKSIWDFINGIDALTAEDVVGLVLLMFMMNLQLFNKLTLKNYDLVPDLKIWQVGLILCVNCCVCVIVIPLVLPSLIILILITASLAGLGGQAIAIFNQIFH